MKQHPIVISFFSGAGGLDMGFQKANYDIKLLIEIEEKYSQTLAKNHPNWNIRTNDIMEYTKDLIYSEAGLNQEDEVDVFIGGSPCQSFSTAGKRQAFADPRGKAMLKYASLIEDVRPKVFVLENVRGLLSASLKHRPLKERGEGFPELTKEERPGSALRYLESKLGSYNLTIELVNAAMYGVPQKRERVFIVGVRKDLEKTFKFPEPTHTEDGLDGKQKWVTVDDVLKELNGKIKDHNFLQYSDERLKYMTMIPKGGGNWRDLPSSVVKKAMGGAYNSGGGRVGFYRRINVNEPSPTLLTSPIQKSTNLGHPYEDRPLSIEEYKAIQGFPQDYKVSGSLYDKYTQIGNAVPVKLAYIIAKEIYKLFE